MSLRGHPLSQERVRVYAEVTHLLFRWESCTFCPFFGDREEKVIKK